MTKRTILTAVSAVCLFRTIEDARGGGCPGNYTFTPPSLPNTPVSAAYSQTLTVTFTSPVCGSSDYPALSFTAGGLPSGITAPLTNPMNFTGTPTTVGYFPFNVHADEGSPAFPPTADQVYSIAVDFLDVPASNPFEPFVMKLDANGVSSGCDATHYCPAGFVTRAGMAVFLLRAKWGGAYVPPPAIGIFADVPLSNPFAPWIEEVYHEGITGGCSITPFDYCPGHTVTRAQMAVLLLRAKWGSAYTPPASAQIFADVPATNPFEPWINELYNEGIVTGCGGGDYCPAAPVNRVGMAAFLVLTFNLSFPPP
jgi:hypothetical protein